MDVTPFVGVWIETYQTSKFWNENKVTPFVGVWIETRSLTSSCAPDHVTPFVGVWIETSLTSGKAISLTGHTLRGCVD